MSAISASMVKVLRERSGAGMMECKKALQETEGDVDNAMKILRERGIAKGAKRAGRTAAEGLIAVASNADNTEAAIIELNCETDFVAKNDDFQNLSQSIADAALAVKANDAEVLAEAKLASGKTVNDAVNDLLAIIGEKLSASRSGYLAADVVTAYIHPPGKIGVILGAKMNGADPAKVSDVLRNVCMHIAAMAPRFLHETEVDTATLDAEREIYTNIAIQEGKPEAIIPKIVDGKIKAFYKDACLVDNIFAMDNKKTVKQVIDEAGKAAGGAVEITGFYRFRVGENAAPAEEGAE